MGRCHERAVSAGNLTVRCPLIHDHDRIAWEVTTRRTKDETADSIDRKGGTLMATIAAPRRIGLADRGRRMTLDEYLEAEVEEGYRYELAAGVLEVTQVPNDPHRQVVTNLYDAISLYRRTHPGVVLSYGGGSEFQLGLPGMITGRNPDLGIVLRGAPKDWRGRTGPALVAEVVSRDSIQRDYETRRGVSGLRPPRILDRRLLETTGHRPDAARRYLE